MKRRDFIAGLGGGTMAIILPRRSGAQQDLVRPLVGLLSPISAAAATPNVSVSIRVTRYRIR